MDTEAEKAPGRASWRSMFGMREKLSLCFASFLIIVIVMGVQDILQLGALRVRIDDILKENFEMVVGSGDMKEGLERIDNGILFWLLGYVEQGTANIDRGRQVFHRGFEVCRTRQGAAEGLTQLSEMEAAFQAYDALIARALASPPNPDQGDDLYAQQLEPMFAELHVMADSIQQLNLTNVVARHGETELYARNARVQTLVVLGIAILLTLAAIYYSGRWLLLPIVHLTAAADAIRQGDLEVRVAVVPDDELGDLVRTFNDMAARLRRLDRTHKARLLKSQAATEKILDNVTDAIALASPDGTVEMASRVAGEVFGLSPRSSLQHARYPWIAELAESAGQSEVPVHGEAEREIVQAFVDGEERFYFPSASAIWDEEAKVSGLLLFFRDITDVLIQQELRQDVIATVSHQLKTPLTSIQMALHLLRAGKFGALNARQDELVETATVESERLLRMVIGLLDTSRLRAGRDPLDCEAVEVRTMLETCMAGVRGEAEAREVQLECACDPDMPLVWVDLGHIEHVFNNLLSNGIRYTPAGGVVSLHATALAACIQVDVRDSGPGIPPEECKRIFEQFYRGPGSDTMSGAGLGLYIAKRIVEAHHGRIWAEGGSGGACFSVQLPRADHRAAAPTTQPEADAGPPETTA